MRILEWLKAVLYGILEGVTEWLPVSSTGHLILLADCLPFQFCTDAEFLDAFWEMFEVIIQLGAICAVLLLFWRRLCPFSGQRTSSEKARTWRLWGRVLLASLPAAAMGILLDRTLLAWTGRDVDGWLFCAPVVAFSLIFYGVIFLFFKKPGQTQLHKTEQADAVTPLQALGVGAFQMLALVPGTSRSGATVLGAELLGLSRKAGAEFSFFMAIPIMLGASAVKAMDFFAYVTQSGVAIPTDAWVVLAIGCVVSFAVSTVAIRFLLDFVKRHSFVPFGVYRIALGLSILFLRW
jgi:undecaprenyl-diphosphatase